jgi:cytochrome oxidase Cu insertion factor (SCO1/SenC/PrrC family)
MEEQNISIETITSLTDEFDNANSSGIFVKVDREDEFPREMLKVAIDPENLLPEKKFREQSRNMLIRRTLKFTKAEQKVRRKGNYFNDHSIDWFFKRYLE